MIARLILTLALVLTSACVSSSLPEGADYRHAYFAALSDYNQAKRIAAAYVKHAPAAQGERILALVELTDARIKDFESYRRSRRVLASARDFRGISRLIKGATLELRAFLAARKASR